MPVNAEHPRPVPANSTPINALQLTMMAVSEPEQGISEYERERLANIERNKSMLVSFV